MIHIKNFIIFLLALFINYNSLNIIAGEFHEAAKSGNIQAVRNFIHNGSNINEKDNDGFTLLEYAAWKGHKEIVKFLLDNGADINARDKAGASALWLAASKGRKEIVEILLAKGAYINIMDNGGYTPLHEAAGGGYKEIVDLLLSKGADVNLQSKNKEGWTPLHFAVIKGSKEVVLILLNKRANPNVEGKDGITPFTLAGIHDRKEIIPILKNYDKDVNYMRVMDADEQNSTSKQSKNENELFEKTFKGLILARNLGILEVGEDNSKNQVFVSAIKQGSLADNSGINKNDVVKEINNIKVQNLREFNEILSKYDIEGDISLCIDRNLKQYIEQNNYILLEKGSILGELLENLFELEDIGSPEYYKSTFKFKRSKKIIKIKDIGISSFTVLWRKGKLVSFDYETDQEIIKGYDSKRTEYFPTKNNLFGGDKYRYKLWRKNGEYRYINPIIDPEKRELLKKLENGTETFKHIYRFESRVESKSGR